MPAVNDDTARDWLLAQPSPEAADAALCRSLTSTLAVTAALRTENRFPPSGGSYRIPVGCDFDVANPENVPLAIAKITAAMTPPSDQQAEAWLTMLQAACARRPDSDVSASVAYALYSGGLRQYPADVARAACEKLARGTGQGVNWFPTYAEMMAMCDRLGAGRKVMLAALQRWGKPEPVSRATASEAERAKVRAMAAAYGKQVDERPKRTVDWTPTPPPTDETGLTAAMRAHLAKQAEP